MPTPHGPIAVFWNRSGKQLRVTVTAPPDTTGTLQIPGNGRAPIEIHSGTYSIPLG
ncbi:alpha-L-rhamnosidase C-terminal domain-containing protein [Nocardia jiangxiensis]|uniref:Alpha-L-rhamnosidase C-terminal domain-containing protein n=1 Tax=Nocardia jiangxiensis TaxID=282685 RepID=A0ABW6S9M9_9NOCA